MEWKEVRLGDIADVQTGPFGSQLHKENYVNKGTPIVTVEHLGNKWFTSQNLPMVSDEDKLRLAKYCSQEGDVIFSRVGSVDRCSYVSKEYSGWLFSGRCLRVRPRSGINPEYLYYFLTNEGTKQYIRNIAVGATMPSINTKLLNEVPITIPSLEDQRRIASILSSLDRKIELNNKINADLEEMAQSIFKNWFVDFEPFKDGKFVDSELGMIPEGWKVGTIGDIVEFQNGFTFSSKDFSENGEYKIITIKSVQDGCLVTEGSSKVTEYPTKMPAYCKLQSGDILLSLTGNVGRCCLVTETNLLLNQRVAKIKAKECYDNSFSYALFRLKETKELLISISRGTAQANLSPVEASKLPMVIPSEDARKSFSMISDSIMNKIISIHIENSRISLLRDTLLPRLMSGELEVPE